MLQRSPNRSIFTIILVTQLCYAFWSWIKSSIILPSHAINHTKKYILAIGRALVIISSLLLPLQIQFVKTRNEIAFIPTMLVIDQSRSMAHNDITPSRRDAALDITNNIYSTEISDTPYNGLSRGDNNTTTITYAQIPYINKLKDIDSLKPITTQQGSSALGDARLIAYDQIGSGLDYKPIVITITDGGSNKGYDLIQTAFILKTRAQLWIVGLSTGTQIVAYDDEGLGLTSTMDSTLLSSLTDSGHRYAIPDDASMSGVITKLSQDLHIEYYNLPPLIISLQRILWVLLLLGAVGWLGIYLTKKKI